jgi:hypothetical protein
MRHKKDTQIGIRFKAPANEGMYAPCRNQDWAEFFRHSHSRCNLRAGTGFYGEV